jgi:hypothetical protein
MKAMTEAATATMTATLIFLLFLFTLQKYFGGTPRSEVV